MEETEPKKGRPKKAADVSLVDKISEKCKELSDLRDLVKVTEKEYKDLLKQKPVEKAQVQDLGALLKVNRNAFKKDPVMRKRMEQAGNVARIKKQVNK